MADALPDSVSLFFREGTSDKVYQAEVVAKGGGYVVNFAYGRRGAKLQTGTKTPEPVAKDKARAIYEKIVQEKMDKGYATSESGGSGGAAGAAAAPDFWDDPFDPDDDSYTGPKLTDKMIQAVEKDLGYKLPASYIRLIKIRNGGTLKRGCFPLKREDSHVELSGISGIGGEWGIDSPELGSRVMIEEWGYPDVGVVIGQTPSAGHDTIMLDYRKSGPQGEPRVIHVETETDDEKPIVTILAPDFESFLKRLVDCEAVDD